MVMRMKARRKKTSVAHDKWMPKDIDRLNLINDDVHIDAMDG